jgi:hypothetical protein
MIIVRHAALCSGGKSKRRLKTTPVFGLRPKHQLRNRHNSLARAPCARNRQGRHVGIRAVTAARQEALAVLGCKAAGRLTPFRPAAVNSMALPMLPAGMAAISSQDCLLADSRRPGPMPQGTARRM